MKRATTQPTMPEALGFGPRGRVAKPAAPTAKTPGAPSAPKPPSMPRAKDLTVEDLAMVSNAMGVVMPAIEGMAAQVSERFADRSRRLADDYLEGMRRYETAVREARAKELDAGAIDGRTATPDQVRARLAGLGLGDETAHTFQPVGRPLDPPPSQAAGREVLREQDVAHQVAREVHRRMQRGQSVNARDLTPAEVRALMEIRGAG